MKKYEEPNLKLLMYTYDDVITVSPGDSTETDDEIGDGNYPWA